jgi:hypothetical protein
VKVGDLVRKLDNVGLVILTHGFGRRTVLWSCGIRQDFWVGNPQYESLSESR